MKRHSLAAIISLLCSALCHAEDGAASPSAGSGAGQPPQKIYKYMVRGVMHFSDVPPLKGAYAEFKPSCFACNPRSTINWNATRLHLSEFADAIRAAAAQYAVDPALVRAVIHAESNFNVFARSPKGARGLMQLMPATAREVGVSDPHSPAQNIRGGVQYLAGLLAQYQGNVMLATAAYNAGPGAVDKYGGIPPYAETQVYVQRVRILHERYRSSGRD